MQTRLKRATNAETSQTKIIDAAIACFETFGAAKTTMEDIAETAGVGRKTVYRMFTNRTALLDTIALQRINHVVERVKRIVDSCASLDEAIVKGTIQSLRLLRKDKIFMAVVESANDRGVEQYLINPTSPVLEASQFAWKDAFARARACGELRDDLNDDQITTWLRGVHLTFLLRKDLTSKGQEELLRTFVLPSLRPSAAVPR